MEERQLLSVSPYTVEPIHVGVVYFEDNIGEDIGGDEFHVSFTGGAAGTELTQLIIDTDKAGDGLSLADACFDTAAGGIGASAFADFSYSPSTAYTVLSHTVVDGGSKLVINFAGFEAGEVFHFTIDVDEMGNGASTTAICEGGEFEGSLLSAGFSAPNYKDIDPSQTTTKFWDTFDFSTSHPDLYWLLPDDDYSISESHKPIQTAGAANELEQEPEPITIAGTVYEDLDLDNTLDPGESGIANVSLTLLQWQGDAATGSYVAVDTTTTNAAGDYSFTNLAPALYRVVETQPTGWISVGAKTGSGATQAGSVENADTLTDIQLLGGDDAIDYDFAEAELASLSGYVYHDANNNGLMDAGESGIAGAQVVLHYTGPLGAATTITRTSAADGSWSATNLLPGNYRITETTPTGYVDGLDREGTAGGTAVNPGDEITTFFLGSGVHGVNYLFGELLPNCISGHVLEDQNGDNLIDAGDTPIAGVTVQLLDDQGAVIQTTTTNSLGEYEFCDLPAGVYGVHEVQPTGYNDGADFVGTAGGSLLPTDSIIDIILVSGTNGRNYDFLEVKPCSISGHVVEDLDGDGTLDPGEPPIAGVLVELLDGTGTVVDFRITDFSGYYEFTNLAPGTYSVRETDPPGYVDGAEIVGSEGGVLVAPNSITSITLTSGVDATDYDFLELMHGSISGRVLEDLDGDGQYDPTPTPIAGATVELLDDQGNVLRTTTSGADGRYSFTDLTPGVYAVRETTPSGYKDGADKVGSVGGTLVAPDTIDSIAIASGVHGIDYDFLEVKPCRISGHVYLDHDGDGVVDPSDTPLADVTVELLNSSGTVIATTLTAADGSYLFDDLMPGVYDVRETTPAGYYDGAEIAGTVGGTLLPPDSITDVVLTSGTWAEDYDFLELSPVSISGYVYEDLDNDGVFDASESPIAGVTLRLLDANGNPTGATAISDAVGYYWFGGLDPNGTYGVSETTPTGYFDGLDTPGSRGGTADNPNGDTIIDVAMTPGVNATDYNFGEIPPASISGRVHGEHNGDCIWQSTEPLLSGVTIYLLDANGAIIATTTTDAKGEYLFDNLAPGTYGVEEVQPAGYLQGNTWIGSHGGTIERDDRMIDIDLGAGVVAVDYNFCEATPATISGYVFKDGATIYHDDDETPPPVKTVRDGAKTSDDTPLAGVVLVLGDGSGAPILDAQGHEITAVTDAKGYYEFTMLPAGLYTILERQPTGYDDGIDTPGSKGGIVVDADDGQTAQELQLMNTIQMMGLDPADAIGRIRVDMGDHAVLNNFSEVQYGTLPPPPPPPPTPIDPLDPYSPSPAYGAPNEFAVVYIPTPADVRTSSGLGGGLPIRYTWHLSVLNAGQPRSIQNGHGLSSIYNVSMQGIYGALFDPALWQGPPANQGQWQFEGETSLAPQAFTLGVAGAFPLAGDFNGDGIDEVAVFVDGIWFIDLNGNGQWDESDLWARMGLQTDQAVVGDWDGDGKDDIATFGVVWANDDRALDVERGLPDLMNERTGRAKNMPPAEENAPLVKRQMKRSAEGNVREDVIDHVFQFGTDGDVAISGDWNGDGVTNIGLYREGTWYFDVDGDGRWSDGDRSLENTGDRHAIPVVGDFNGDAISDIGLFRDGHWHVDSNGDGKLDENDRQFDLGTAGDLPVVGDFNGDGVDQAAVFRADAAPPERLGGGGPMNR